MKRNKKLLLGAVAAMGAVAIGTGAVSTFAWYASTAGASAILANSGHTVTLTTTKGTASDVELSVLFTITTITKPELSNGAGETWYKIGDQLYQKTSPNNIGQYQISAAFSTQDKAVWAASGKSDPVAFTAYVKAAASDGTNPYAKLLKNNSSAADGTDNANIAASHAVVCSIATNGNISITSVNAVNGANGYFVVRTNKLTAASADTFTPVEEGVDDTHMNYADLLVMDDEA